MKKTQILFLLTLWALGAACSEDKPGTVAGPEAGAGSGEAEASGGAVVVKSEGEWKKKLTAEQFRVTRESGTERPFGAIYEEFNKQGAGTYYCVCCGVELFTSGEKFQSGCGWPSFYDQSKAKNVAEVPDADGERIEVTCRRCEAHLGHVFDKEGFATPTDRRFCINGVALHFVPLGGKAPELEEVASDAVQKKKAAVAEEGGAGGEE